ncbi:MAG: hypothetical protein HYX85_00465 [Chloroflexi bacterium]|nr:hypothetical protein [Chloroflexota bacterium]
MGIADGIRLALLIMGLMFSIIYAGFIFVWFLKGKKLTRKHLANIVLLLGLLFITYLAYNVREIPAADWAQIMLTLALVVITGFYALSTANIVEEMRKQRYDTVRPVIDIRWEPKPREKENANRTGLLSGGMTCKLYNVGLGPALDIYSFTLDSGQREQHSFDTLGVAQCSNTPIFCLDEEDGKMLLKVYYRDAYGNNLESRREVIEKTNQWRLGPLQIYTNRLSQ